MKVILTFIFSLLIVFTYNQLPDNKVINNCGKKSYDQPDKPEDCKSRNEICCFVDIKFNQDNNGKRFCASSPTIIEGNDIIDDIKGYTGASELKIQCFDKSSSSYIKFLKTFIILNILAFLYHIHLFH